MTKFEQQMDQALEITNDLIVTQKSVKKVYPKQSFDEDFDEVLSNMKDLSSKGFEALENIMAVAEGSEHPRAYEVVHQLIKTIGEVNAELLTSYEKKKKYKEELGQNIQANTVNQNVYVGSSADLLKIIKENE